MNNQIILNGEPYAITESDLPYLVTYGEKAGGSHFTITLLKDLFLSGSKILFLTAFPMARDNFLSQIGEDHSRVALVSSVTELEKAFDAQVILLESGNENLFIEALKTAPDIDTRVVLVKNIEAFSAAVFDACLGLTKIILSGNLDECISKNQIAQKNFQNIVVFTKTETPLPVEVPELEKWTGYLSGADAKGIIKVLVE